MSKFKCAEILSKDIKKGSFVKIKGSGKSLFVEKALQKNCDGIVEKVINNVAWIKILKTSVKPTTVMSAGSSSGFLVEIPKVTIKTSFKVEK